MKKTIFALVLLTTYLSVDAQIIVDKKITDKGGYGEKKLKKAPKKIYISKFAGYFQVAKEGEASTSGGQQVGGASYAGATYTKMAIAIDGVDSEDFIAIMDKAYAQFVDGLKAQSYEIISADVAGATDYYEGWKRKKGGSINNGQLNGFLMATPTSYSYYVKKTSKKGKEKAGMMDTTPKLSKALNNAIVVSVSFAFPSINMKTSGGTYSFGSSVKATIDYRMSPVVSDGSTFGIPAYTSIKMTQGKGPGMSALAIAVTSIKSDVAIEGVFEDTKFKEKNIRSTTDVTSNPGYYSVVFTETKSTAVTHTAKADHDKYISKTNEAIGQLIDVSLDNLKINAGN